MKGKQQLIQGTKHRGHIHGLLQCVLELDDRLLLARQNERELVLNRWSLVVYNLVLPTNKNLVWLVCSYGLKKPKI